jgi:hypothetical protein
MCFPIAGGSERQVCVSSSTTQADFVASHEASRATSFPAWDGFGILRGLLGSAPSRFRTQNDNTAMLEAIRAGRNLTMRHLPRVRGVAVGWLRERYSRHVARVSRVDSSMTTADICAKPFSGKAKWEVLCRLLGVMTLDQVESGAVARRRECTVLDDPRAMMTSGYDLGSASKFLRGWDSA